MVEVSCPHCGVKLKAPEDRVGKKAKCKKCQQPFQIPGPVPMAESVDDTEDDRTELMSADQMSALASLPAPKAKPAPAAAPPKVVAALPSADPFDFSKPAAPVAKPAPAPLPAAPPPAAKPAFGAGKAAPPKSTAPVPAPAPPVAAPAPAPTPAVKPAFGAAMAKPVAKAPEPLPIDDAEPLADIPSDEPPKSKLKTKSKPAAEPLPEPEPEPAPNDNAFAFGFTDAPSESPKKKKKRTEEDEEPEAPKSKKKRTEEDEDEEPEPKKPAAKGKAKAAPASDDGAFAFGFTDEPSPPEAAKPKKKKRNDDEDEPEEPGNKKAKKKRDEEPEDEEDENKPRYLRPEEKGSGMAKMMLITAVVGFFALGLGIVAIVVYVKNNRPIPEAKKEEKKEDPIPEAPAPPPVIGPPVTPKDKVDPKPKDKVDPKAKDKVDPKPKDKEPEPKPKDKEKEPDPVPTRPGLELAIKSKPFEIGKEPAKFERADKPGEPRFTLDSTFASVLRVFPPFDPKSADTYVAVREGAKFSLDAYSPSSEKRASRLDFATDAAKPLCDVYTSATDSRFLAVANGKITVWNLADQKKLFDALEPYAGKPDHEKNGIAAAFFATDANQIVVVSTAGAVHLYNLQTRASTAEFVPPHGAKGKVVLGESVARAEGGGSIVLAVGGVLYQIQSNGNLERIRTHDLGGDAKSFAVAASGTPGRLLFAFETDAKGKKDRGLLYLPLGAGAKEVVSLWPTAAGTPKSAFWVSDTSVGVATESGVVWFDSDEETKKFAPLVVTRPTAGTGLYLGAGNMFWYVVPHPSQPAQSVLVPLAIPLGDVFDFRREAATRLRVVRIDPNGLAK